MTSDSYRTYFIPFGEMRPDSPEYSSEFMEHVVNYLPVYSGYRPVVRPIERSRLDNADPVTGSHVHRSTERTGIEILQPAVTGPSTGPNIYSVPDQPQNTFHQLIRGAIADDGQYVIFSGQGPVEEISDNQFQIPSRTWSTTGTDLVTARMRYRIKSGATGNYSLTLSYGHFVAAVYTEVDTIVVAGDLAVDGDDLFKFATDTSALSNWPANPENSIIGYEIRGQIDAQAVVQYWPASTLAQSLFSIVGGDATVHQAIDKSGGTDDARYVLGVLGSGSEDQVQVGFQPINQTDRDSIAINVRYEVTDVDMRLLVDLIETVNEVDEVRQTTEVTPPGADTPIDVNIMVLATNYDSIENLNNISLKVGFRGVPGSAGQTFPVTGVDSQPAASWTQYGAGTPTGVFGDADDGTGFESASTVEDSPNIASALVLDIPVNNAPPVWSPTAVEVTARFGRTGTNRAVFQFELFEGATTVFLSASVQVEDGTFVDFSQFLTQNQFNSISNFNDLILVVYRKTNQGADVFDNTSQVAEAAIVTDTGESEGRVYEANFEQAGDAQIDVSWVNLDAELEGTFLPGDSIKLYYGLFTKIYELSESFLVWNDVSKAGDYIDVESTSWSFTTWGDKAIATNRADPVQVKNIGDTEFRDLFGFDNAGVAIPDYATDGFEFPRARFVAAINAFLCIANVDDASYVDGRPYSFWCSAIGDPTRMHPGDFNTQSSLFQLVSTPGEITGLIGGEYGILFKEDSVYRVDYVGFPPIFNFEQLQVEQGCPYPRSIVRAGGDVYFWGAHGIFRVINGRSIEDVSTGKVDKMLFDSLFEGLAIDSDVSSDQRRNDSKVFGTYDPFSENIYWNYKLGGANPYQNEAILCYNVHRRQFTILLATGLSLRSQPASQARIASTFPVLYNGEAINSLGNRLLTSVATTRGVVYVEREEDPPLQFNNVLRSFTGQETEQGLMDSNTIGSNEFPGAEGAREIDMQQIRPVYRTETNKPTPKIDIKIQSGQFPDLDSGEVQERNISTDNQNTDGWISISPPLSGEFFTFEAQTEFTPEPSLKEFEGLQIRYRLKAFR